jgi:hypothetical protein
MIRILLSILWTIGVIGLAGSINDFTNDNVAFAQQMSATSNIVTVIKNGDRNRQQQPFTFVGQGSVNSSGDISFIGTNAMMSGIYLKKSPLLGDDSLREIVTTLDSTPFGGRFGNFTAPKMNDNGEIVFSSALSMATRVGGIFLARNGQITPIVLVDDPTPVGGNFENVLATNLAVSINNRREVAFLATIRGASTRSGIFIAQDGQLRKLVTDGELLPQGERIAFVADTLPVLNNHGDVLLAADRVSNEGTRRRTLFLATNNSLQPIANIGDTVSDGGTLEAIQGRGRLLNDNRVVGFLGRVNGRLAIYLAVPTTTGWELRRLVGVGDLAPDGGTFTDLNLALGPTNCGLNNRQDLVFRATTTQTFDGLFVSVNGALHRIVGKRDATNLGGTVPVEAALIGAFLGTMIADNAVVVFEAAVQGGVSSKGIFLWMPTPLPLPQINSVRYQNKRLQLTTTNLGASVVVEINGQVPNVAVQQPNVGQLTLSGSRKKLGLNRTANSNRIIIITNGLRSAEVSF